VNGKYMEANYVPIRGFNTLTARILAVDSFRKQYKTMLEEILEEKFTLEFIMPRAERMTQHIRPYLLNDPYKKEYIDEFDQEIHVIEEYIKDRRAYLQGKLSKLD